ncbi:sensor histidine kinase [Achromobacter sp. GG226]|nr:sensor histidine kinase [Verticiella sp. GG226]
MPRSFLPFWRRAARAMPSPRSLRRLLPALPILLCVLACGYAAYHLSNQAGIRALADNGERQLELHARAVQGEISTHTYLPSLLELEASVTRLLLIPTDYRRQRVNEYLEGLNSRSGSRAIYVMDTSGRVLAASNWRDADSFQGEDLSFRAYFQDAMQGRPGRFYGIGSTTGEAGYYLAHGLRNDGEIIGVAVVKIRLDTLEQRWERARLEAFVSDANGIIILSSDPARRLKAVRPLDDDQRARLAGSLQYHWTRLDELTPLAREPFGAGELLTLPAADANAPPIRYLAQTLPLVDPPWEFTLLSPLQDVQREAWRNGLLAAVAFALVAFLLIAWNERRKVVSTRLAAREALEEANSQLERKIADRTAHLRASNDLLRAQIRERRQAEETLRKAQDDLVQAGKLAVIGQMSTSIAHELNQPLAAVRTLAGNSVRFLQRGNLEVTASNLHTINSLIDHMGRITASLRAFARRSDDTGRAQLGKAVDAAIFLLHSRLETTPVTLVREVDDVPVGIDQTRLEQILVNLIVNALDAMAPQRDRRLWLHGETDGKRYCLTVRDNGPGVPPEARVHLFEPFFTTKPGEQGLGLGLTLSASLAAAAGGNLAVQHPTEGGTAFVLTLPLLDLPGNPADV